MEAESASFIITYMVMFSQNILRRIVLINLDKFVINSTARPLRAAIFIWLDYIFKIGTLSSSSKISSLINCTSFISAYSKSIIL